MNFNFLNYFLTSVIVLSLLDKSNSMFLNGGGCGCRQAPPLCPMLPPPPICPPLQCPMPPPCPPTYCPPPIIPIPCPPPLPPPNCPSLLPPLPSPCGCNEIPQIPQLPIYQPSPIYSVAPSNDCCCQCGSPCRYRSRARTHGARIFSVLAAEVDEDPTCNNEKLKKIIEEHITEDPTTSKRAIQTAAEEKLFAKINVICAKADFSYVAYTDTYCQASHSGVTCYAFRPLAPETKLENALPTTVNEKKKTEFS